ncbi:MAG: prepilin-type N-terminal cleavage/methylation domain-containing protein [Planctomycetes bacterium]|nr:prepilin-type N-terminal cleavage/methylation domain-containing protein [Planctomycetota bacterium]
MVSTAGKNVTAQRDIGFTLIELMIVVAVISIIAAIAIPNMLRSRMAANEVSCIGSLKTLSTQQAIFAQQGEVDQDGDGNGESGWLAELSGEICPRKAAAIPNPRPVTPIYISQGFATGGSAGLGYSEKAGYFFRMYLAITTPTGVAADAGDDKSADGTTATWGTPLDPTTKRVAINMQENIFLCQAWPGELYSTGSRCFVINEIGQVYGSKMTNRTYTGSNSEMDDYSLCFSANGDGTDGWWNDRFAASATDLANDGNLYTPME